MTVTGQTGIFAYGIQSDKGTFATTMYRHFVNDVNFGPIQDLRSFPLEVGSVVVPTGGYKAGVFVGGGATLQPRLAGDFGWLIKALMGQASTSPTTSPNLTGVVNAGNPAATGLLTLAGNPPTTRRLRLTVADLDALSTFKLLLSGTDVDSVVITELVAITANGTFRTIQAFKTITSANIVVAAVEGAGSAVTLSIGWDTAAPYLHTFKFNTDPTSLPWVSVEKKIPGSTSFGEKGKDCRLTGIRFNFPQNGLLTARVDTVGREPIWEEGGTVDAWSFAGPFENFKSVPATCVVNGFVKLPNYSSDAQPITSLSVTMANNFTSPQQEMIVGSPYPDDFAILSRGMMLNAVLKWKDASLYKELVGGGTLNWDPSPFFSDFQAKIMSPALIPGSSDQYSIQVDAGEVMWQPQASPVPAGGGIIMLPLVGQVQNPDAGEYCSFTIGNDQASY